MLLHKNYYFNAIKPIGKVGIRIEFFQLHEKMSGLAIEDRSLAFGANALPYKLTGPTTNELISLR